MSDLPPEPYPLGMVRALGYPIADAPNAPNLILVRSGVDTPGTWDGWLWLVSRTPTGTDALAWASLVFPATTRPGWDAMVAGAPVPVIQAGHYAQAWELVSDGPVSVLRNVRPVRTRMLNGPSFVEGDPYHTSQRIHVLEVTDPSDLDGSIGLALGAMPRLVAAIRRLQAHHGGPKPLSMTILEER
jgi:hypothetical protein